MAKRAETSSSSTPEDPKPARTSAAPSAEITSLYRLHRPQRFAELIGQEHVTQALKHALVTEAKSEAVRDQAKTEGAKPDTAAKHGAQGGVGHAYLFSGPRGTGKTTTARLFAKALNCLDFADDGEPCGECANCKCFTAEGITFPDLFEIDAASTNGVENIRDLIQRVNMGLGATSKKKVYLIDEVHMLSGAAANALLKTLEEPPRHVVFVLATTDPQKVLPTVRSRTQHFDFKLLDHDQLTTLVKSTLRAVGHDEPDTHAVELIVRKAAGSGRDSLSLLDQALALGKGSLQADAVRSMLGTTDFDRLVATLRAIAAEDPATALVEAHRAFEAGSDVRRFADELLRVLRDAFVHKAADGAVQYDGPAEDVERLGALADAFGLAGLTRGIEMLGETIADIRGQHVPDPRLLLEVAIVRLARPDTRGSLEALAERVERLERHMNANPASPTTSSPEPERSERPARAAPATPAPSGRAVRSGSSEPGATPSSPPSPPSPPSPRAPRSALGAHRREPTSANESTSAVTTLPAPDDADAPDPEASSSPALAFDLDDVIVAWSAALGLMKPPVRAAVSDAQPIAVDGDVITFGVPRGPRADLMRKRFRDESGDVKGVLSEQLGAEPRFKVVSHDFAAHDAFASPGGQAGDENGDGEAPNEPDVIDLDEVDDYVDPSELVDAPSAPVPLDATARLLEGFSGAEVVAERPR